MRRSPPPSLSTVTETNSLFVLEHGDRKVVVPRPSTYEDVLDAVIRLFPELSITTKAQIRLSTTKLNASGGQPVEISDDSWPVVSQLIDGVTISMRRSSSGESVFRNGGSPGTAFMVEANFEGHIGLLKVSPTTRFGLLRRGILHRFGLPEDRVRIRWHGPGSDGVGWRNPGFVPDDATLSKAGITDQAQIEVQWEQIGGLYPGICLWSPTPQHVDVHLNLSSCWHRVETVLPPAIETITPRIDSGSDTDIHWSVDVKDDTLHNVGSQFDCHTLYWKTPLDAYEGDDLYINDNNAVVLPVLPVNGLIAYLSDAFAFIGVPEKAKEAFMTHTLARLIGEHTHLAIRFVSQELLAKHANLSVSPSPEAQMRVVLLYKRIHVSWLKDWPQAIARGKLGGQYWKDVVGISDEVARRVQDKNLFRVFEWGTVHVT